MEEQTETVTVEKVKKERIPKAMKSFFISKYDFNRAIEHEDYYEIPPENTSDITDELKKEIIFNIALGRNKVFITKLLNISPNKLDLFMNENFQTKKITKIREIVMLEDSPYPDIQQRVVNESSKKKGKKKQF